MRTYLLAAALLLLPPQAATVAAETTTGPARATAPETLVIAGTRFRLAEVRVPDGSCGGVPCADAARARLAELAAAGGPVTCSREARLGHGVYRSRCRLADGRDVAGILTGEGLLQVAAAP